MLNNKNTVIALVITGLILAIGITHLMTLRFKSGDTYPPYSSLRADPLGTKALYESLSDCHGISVSRNYEKISKLDSNQETTLLYLGDTISNNENIPSNIAGQLNGFVRKGGRLVFVFYPCDNVKLKDKTNCEKKQDDDEVEDNNAEEKNNENKAIDDTIAENDEEKEDTNDSLSINVKSNKTITPNAWLGTIVKHERIPTQYDGTDRYWPNAYLATNIVDIYLPNKVSCHTSMYFAKPDPKQLQRNEDEDEDENNQTEQLDISTTNLYPWRTIYSISNKPVIIEKQIGKGSIVLSALSYFVSNEAMKNERHPQLLLWLLDGNKNIIFDETHHGIARPNGFGSLIKTYRLQGLICGLILLAILFAWKNNSNLVPPNDTKDDEADNTTAQGRDSTSALLNLLRQNINSSDILSTCLNEYKNTINHTDQKTTKTIAKMSLLVKEERERPIHKRNPSKIYNNMTNIRSQHEYRKTQNDINPS